MTKKNINYILIILLVLLVLAVGTWLVIEYGLKRWSCTREGGCERVIGGHFKTKQECEKQCPMNR